MQAFLPCFLRVLFYTLGVITLCGLLVEICYRLCFLLMGRQAGRAYWIITSWLGTPVHELGHALMCLLFAHRIEKIQLLPRVGGNAMVEHSYSKGNLYAASGNLWIGLGPVFSCLAVIIAVLCLVFPVSMSAFWQAMRGLLSANASVETVLPSVKAFFFGLFTETTRPLIVRVLAIWVLFSMSLHVRVSAQDVWSMLPGLPCYVLLAALFALVSCIIGENAVSAVNLWSLRIGSTIVGLFCLILLFSAAQIVLAFLLRLIGLLAGLISGNRGSKESQVNAALLEDCRHPGKSWEEYKK